MADHPSSKERTLWMAWSDQDDGWISAIHGTSEVKEHIEQRIARDVEEYGRNRYGTRPVRVTVHLSDDPPSSGETVVSEEHVRMFIGWLSADIPELHRVEVPRLADSWECFKRQLSEKASAERDDTATVQAMLDAAYAENGRASE